MVDQERLRLGRQLLGVDQVVGLPAAPFTSGASAANAPVSQVLRAQPGFAVRIMDLFVSYSAAPAGGRLTIVVAGSVVFDVDITAAGLQAIPLADGGLGFDPGQDVTLTLAAGGAAVVGKISGGYLLG